MMPLFSGFLRALALGAGTVLLFLMLMTVGDVVLRYVFNTPFEGSQEVTEFSMVAHRVPDTGLLRLDRRAHLGRSV